MTDDLITFYRARLDEVERDALSAKGATPGVWRGPDSPFAPSDIVLYDKGGKLTLGQARHIARHDPASILADVEGMRHLVWLYERDRGLYEEAKAAREAAGERGSSDDEDYFYTAFDAMRQAVQCAAARYRTHPDYQWKWAIGVVSPDELRAMQARDGAPI